MNKKRDWFKINHPEPRKMTSIGSTFMCPKCKHPKELFGSKQRTSKVTGKRIRICRTCHEKSTAAGEKPVVAANAA